MKKKFIVEFLSELQNVDNIARYLDRMELSASQQNGGNVHGLRGNIFYIKWFSKWFNLPIVVCSLKK